MSGNGHRVDVDPGYCWINNDQSKNHGIRSCQIRFSSIGDRGAVYLRLSLDWYTSAARNHLAKFDAIKNYAPTDCGIGYHSAKQTENEDEFHCQSCRIIGGECFSDENGLDAERWIEGFLNGGTEWLWPKLDQYYAHVFWGAAYPDLTPVVMPNPST